MRRSAIVIAALALLLPASALAIPIHRHKVVTKHKQVRVPDDHHVALVPVKDRVTTVVDVAPPYVPPKPQPAPAPATTSVATAAPTPAPTSVPAPSGGTASAIPGYITACESGGNYSAVNPSSGAYGAYQIMPSTSAAYGCDMSTPAGQDACAAKIYSDVGASAWSCG